MENNDKTTVLKESDDKVSVYKETSSGLTSPMQITDKTSAVKFVHESTDASKIPRITYS